MVVGSENLVRRLHRGMDIRFLGSIRMLKIDL